MRGAGATTETAIRRAPGTTTQTIAAIATVAVLLSVAPGIGQQSHEQQVTSLREAGRLEEAARVACQWASLDPGSIPALRACAELGAKVGRYRQAEEALRSLLFYTPSDPDVLITLGDVLLDRGLYEQARQQYEAAILLTDAPARAYTGLARASVYDSDSPGDVLSAAEVALAIAPDYPPAHVAMGVALREVGRLDEAVETLQQAREMDPDLPRATFELGRTWALLGEDEYANRAWERYAEMAPWSPETWLLQRGLLVTDVEEIIDRGFEASYSPDGARIAYRARGEGGWGVYTIPAEGPLVETRLWATESSVQSLAWSPDGSQIAVSVLEREQTADGKQQWTRKILLVPAEGGDAKMLLEDRYLGEIAWNPANGRIGVRSYVRRRGYTIVQVDPATGESEEIRGMAGRMVQYSPAWSRDGSQLLVIQRSDARPDGTFSYDLMVGPADDFSAAQAIFTSDDLPRGPIFTPDGSAILFALPGPVERRLNIWAIPPDGSRDPVLVDHLAGTYGTPSISPDGRYMLTTRDTMLARATLAGLRQAAPAALTPPSP